jgi:hypothetical protein
MTHDYKRHGTTTLFAALNVPAITLEPGVPRGGAMHLQVIATGDGHRLRCDDGPVGSSLTSSWPTSS